MSSNIHNSIHKSLKNKEKSIFLHCMQPDGIQPVKLRFKANFRKK